MKILLAGQRTLNNKGCEALVVSTITRLRSFNPNVAFVLPSENFESDNMILEKYGLTGITLIKAPEITLEIRLWNKITNHISILPLIWFPSRLRFSKDAFDVIRTCDLALHIGGDNFSFDYSYAGLVSNTALIDELTRLNITQRIWCATIGPFSKNRFIEQRVMKKFNRLSEITVREPETKEYLELFKVKSRLVCDPAFSLQVESQFDVNCNGDKQKYIVINLSPYVYKDADQITVKIAFQEFVSKRISEGYDIVLLSHVNTKSSSDTFVLNEILEKFLSHPQVTFAPENLTSSGFKSVVNRACCVVAVRTHVTIAGFSTCTPTLSIGYSAKAFRLNEFIFGGVNYVIPSREVSQIRLESVFQNLLQENEAISTALEKCVSKFRLAFDELCSDVIGSRK